MWNTQKHKHASGLICTFAELKCCCWIGMCTAGWVDLYITNVYTCIHVCQHLCTKTHTHTHHIGPYNHNVFTTQRLFDRFITPCIDYIIDGLNNMRNPLKRVIHQTNLNMVTQFCCMFDAIFPTLKAPNVTVAGGIATKTAASTAAAASISMAGTTSASIDDDAIIECGFIDVKIQNDFVFSHLPLLLLFATFN